MLSSWPPLQNVGTAVPGCPRISDPLPSACCLSNALQSQLAQLSPGFPPQNLQLPHAPSHVLDHLGRRLSQELFILQLFLQVCSFLVHLLNLFLHPLALPGNINLLSAVHLTLNPPHIPPPV